MGSFSSRQHGSQAAESKIYDAPKAKACLLKDDVLKQNGISEVPGASKYHSERDTTRMMRQSTEDTADDPERGTVDHWSPSNVQRQGETGDSVTGKSESQYGSFETVPASHAAVADLIRDKKSSTVEELELLGKNSTTVGPTDSAVRSSPTLRESDVHEELPELDEVTDAEDWKVFQEYGSDSEETLDDVDLLRTLDRRTLSEDQGSMDMGTLLEPQSEPNSQQEPTNRAIHILGLGAAGKYIAHCLAALPFPPPITLLMHRPLMMQHWHDEGAAIHIIKGNEIKTQTNFHIESSADFVRDDPRQSFPGFGPMLEHTAEPPSYPIDALIVTTEAYKTVSALTAIRHRLGRNSTILILSNGLGLVERLNEKVFPDLRTRPTYILGTMSHNLESTQLHFTLSEKKPGRLECSKLPQMSMTRRGRGAPKLTRKDFSWTAPASHLVRSLARTPEFGTVTLGHKSFYESRLQSLAASAVIGPLSVVFDCSNDLLLYNYSASQAMKLLLREISQVIRALPELQSLPNLQETFSTKRLEAIIVSKISKTGKNLSAMLQNVRAGNRTNIEYYNGYIERRARQLNISTPNNRMMLHLVKGKSAVKSRELNSYVPFEEDY